jgi:type IV pilus assembly protein PilB
MNFIDLRGVNIPPAIIEKVPESIARENVIIPLTEENGILQIVISDPSDYETIMKLQFILKKEIQPVLAPKEQIVEAINRHYFALP